VTQGRLVVDPAQRVQIYREVQRIVADDLPMIPLWHEDNVAAINVDVKGYSVLPNATYVGLTRATKRAR
jgi:peptide/nickel transport system substrate-binding protein